MTDDQQDTIEIKLDTIEDYQTLAEAFTHVGTIIELYDMIPSDKELVAFLLMYAHWTAYTRGILVDFTAAMNAGQIAYDTLSTMEPIKLPDNKWYVGDIGFKTKSGAKKHIKSLLAILQQKAEENKEELENLATEEGKTNG